MESTTSYSDIYHDYDDPTNITYTAEKWKDPVNMPVFLGFGITFLVVECIVNFVVIVLIARLYITRPETRCGFPHICVMLAFCVTALVNALGPTAVALHLHLRKTHDMEDRFNPGCHSLLALEVSAFMFFTITRLLVAAVILMEAVRLQTLVNLTPRIQMGLAVLLVLLSVGYSLVIIIPVFFFTWLQHPSEPCDNEHSLNFQSDFNKTRTLHIFDYILPHCFVLMACFLLVLSYLSRRAASGPHGGVHYSRLSSQPGSSQPGNNPNVSADTKALPQSSHPPHHATGPGYVQLPPIVPSQPDHVSFPIHLLLAAVVSIVLGFVSFLGQFVGSDALGIDFKENRQLWAAGFLLLELSYICVPCCWLLDTRLRSLWCSCTGGT